MSLDAFVFCDCFERGRLKEPPPAGCRIVVGTDGSVENVGEKTPEGALAFDDWRWYRMCEHPEGILLHHRIGNIALVSILRAELRRFPDRFPMILSKVVYNGIHASDFIPAQDVERLRPELKALAEVHSKDANVEWFLRSFEMQMSELVDCALRVDKPISF